MGRHMQAADGTVEEGRGVFDNLTKFIVWALPTSMGEGLVILTAIVAATTLPILPVQVLWVNMATALALGLANRRGSSKHHPALPLFTADDAERALELLRPVPFDTVIELSPTVIASFHRAGHILGAASVRVADANASTLFSGDLGRTDDPVMRPPADPPAADHIVIESTHGNRRHFHEDPADALADIITATARRDRARPRVRRRARPDRAPPARATACRRPDPGAPHLPEQPHGR